MVIQKIEYNFSVCKLSDWSAIDLTQKFYFLSRTDEEMSLVCITDNVPDTTVQREDGWKAFRIQGVLDFSLIGILAKISTLLAENTIGVFAVSTYNTDYIFIKSENYTRALDILDRAGYRIL